MMQDTKRRSNRPVSAWAPKSHGETFPRFSRGLDRLGRGSDAADESRRGGHPGSEGGELLHQHRNPRSGQYVTHLPRPFADQRFMRKPARDPLAYAKRERGRTHESGASRVQLPQRPPRPASFFFRCRSQYMKHIEPQAAYVPRQGGTHGAALTVRTDGSPPIQCQGVR